MSSSDKTLQKKTILGILFAPLIPAAVFAFNVSSNFSDWFTSFGALLSWYLVILAVILTLWLLIAAFFGEVEHE